MKREFPVLMLLAAIPVMACQTTAQGQAASRTDLAQDGTRTIAGLGVGVAPDYEGSDDYEAVPIPWLHVEFENNMSISIMGNTGKADLIPDEDWQGGIAFEYIKERDDVDNDKVDAMKDIDAALMAGGFFGYEGEQWSAGIEALADMSDNNDGTIVRLRGGYKVSSTSACKTSINVYTTWADDDYMDTYFGVTPADAGASGLSIYQADEGFKDIGVTINSVWKSSDTWSVFSVVGWKLLLDEADDSPVVDEGDSNQFFGGVGFTYRF